MKNKVQSYFEDNAIDWDQLYKKKRTLNDFFLEERKNITIDYILKNIPKDKMIIDIGGGAGLLSAELISHGYQVDLLDISSGMTNLAKKNYEKLNIDYEKNRIFTGNLIEFDFKNFLKYDLVVCLGFFEYQTEIKKSFDKLFSITNYKSEFIFNIPIQNNISSLFGLSWIIKSFKSLFVKIKHPGLKNVDKTFIKKYMQQNSFALVKNVIHGCCDIYILNKIIPLKIQNKISNFLKFRIKNKSFYSNEIFIYKR